MTDLTIQKNKNLTPSLRNLQNENPGYPHGPPVLVTETQLCQIHVTFVRVKK